MRVKRDVGGASGRAEAGQRFDTYGGVTRTVLPVELSARLDLLRCKTGIRVGVVIA
jgi:hypothetical protein